MHPRSDVARDINVLGASAGGIEALSSVVRNLSGDLPAAVFVVLHVPEAGVSRVHIPIIMIGNDLRVRRFTPMASQLFHLIPSDLGWLITDLEPKVHIPLPHGGVFVALDHAAAPDGAGGFATR